MDFAPPAHPAGKKRNRAPILIAAGVGALFLCVCVFLALSFLVARSRSTQTPVVVVEVTATADTGAVLLADDFSDPGTGWDVFDKDNTTAAYVAGEYRVGVYQDNYMAWGNPPGQEFDDFVVEVDARTVDGPLDNNFGILVRYQPDDNNFYWFEISADGYYTIDILKEDEWTGLMDWAASDAINQGIGATNHLKVVCDRDQFSFYVNDTYLTGMTDSTFGSGNVGLAVGTFDEPGAVVHFDNLQVYGLQE